MDRKSVQKEKEPEEFSARASSATPGGLNKYRTTLLLDIQRIRLEGEDLEAEKEERTQKLEILKAHIQAMQVKIKRMEELHSDFKRLHKEKDPHRTERQRKGERQREEEEKRLTEEFVELTEKKEELKRQVERYDVFDEYMEQVVKMTTFQDAQKLTSHVESLLHFKEQLCQKVAESDQQVEEKKKALGALGEQHHLVQLQGSNRLSQLQTELADALSEASTWERKWNHIQETAAKKTLQLGAIKMAVLNLYEMTGGNDDEEDAVDITDTERQLDKVKRFIRDHDEFLRHLSAKSKGRQDHKGKSQDQKPHTVSL
ncbi:coiled-coil domain-containing protein 42 [Notolabrus celidotus]|uniref:coiled-coil domain-containing protein 42 n=1 Tax=Notolabrus celidotus TaxID=1203425 RepID=UPI00148FF07F|nr:coiled-coil domain-containing protein 42 [Notolabrus celidotus]